MFVSFSVSQAFTGRFTEDKAHGIRRRKIMYQHTRAVGQAGRVEPTGRFIALVAGRRGDPVKFCTGRQF